MGAVELVAAGLLLSVAGAVQGFTGFGFSLLAAPVLVALLPPKQAVPVLVALALVLSLRQASVSRREVEVGVFRRVAVASLVGMPVGLALFALAPAPLLRVAVGLVVVISAVSLMWSWVPSPGRGVDVAAGVASGLLKTSVGLNGPPVAVVLRSYALGPGSFRGTMAAILAVGNVAGLLLFVLAGALGWAEVVLVVAALPLVLLG